jgi:hypothetical protein
MNHDTYAKRQAQRDAQYEREYRAWIDSLSPEERRELKRQGLDRPNLARHGSGAAAGDAAESSHMRQGDDPAILPDDAPEPGSHIPCGNEAVWAALRRMIGEVISHNNARLTAECLALVSGLSYSGSSMTQIAKRHGVTRAAVSKRCVELTELLDLRPSRAMRSLTARKRYREARIRSTQSHERSAARQ